jgi:hypothetical protein
MKAMIMGTGKGWQGGHGPLEIWDYKVIIRNLKEKEQNTKENMEKMCVAQLLAACQ